MWDIDSSGVMSFEGKKAQELANEFGSPLYIYSKSKILENITSLTTAMGKYFPKFKVQYAVKANTNPHILKIIQEAGLGADCSSPVEAEIAKRVGFEMSESTYTGNFESQDDFKRAMATGMKLNLDDYHRLDDVLKIATPEVLSFRINPGIGRGGFEGIVTGGNDAKFGIPYEEVRTAYKHAIDRGIKRFGIHMMTGSNILEPFYFAEITQKLLYIIEENLLDLGIKFEYINIGGGLGVPYTKNEKPLDLDATFKQVSDVFHSKVKALGIGDPALVMEPGRFLVGNAGTLISTVTHIKKSYKNYMGLDSGMNTLLRPSLYGAYHEAVIDGKPGTGETAVRICGQICENSDIHPLERKFNNPQSGDLVAIRDCGAYGFVMSSNYNNRERAAEILIDQGVPRLIRRRETIDDIFDSVPDFDL